MASGMSLGSAWGVFDDCDTPCLLLTWMSCGCGFPGGVVSQLSRFVGWRMSVHYLWPEVAPHTQGPPLVGGESVQTWQQEIRIGNCGLPQPEAREGWFSGQLLGLALQWMLSQPYVSSQSWDDWTKVSFYLISSSLTNSQSKVSFMGPIQGGFGDAAFHINVQAMNYNISVSWQCFSAFYFLIIGIQVSVSFRMIRRMWFAVLESLTFCFGILVLFCFFFSEHNSSLMEWG